MNRASQDPLRVGQLTEPAAMGRSELKFPFWQPNAEMSCTDEPPNPRPDLPRGLDYAGPETLLAYSDVVRYCERRGLSVSADLKAFLLARLSPDAHH